MATQTGSIDLKGMTSAYSEQQQYFWVESNSSATWGGGAHITNIAESAFKTAAGTWGTDPTAGGYNLLMNTDTISGTGSLQLRNGSLPMMNLDNDSLDFYIMDSTTTPYTTINVAQFGVDGARIGDANNAHSVIDDKGQRFYAVDGTTRLANIGYDEGTTSTGGTDIAPYYTFGVRKTTTTAYSSSSTYVVGDMCVYDEKIYICIYDITTPESWTSSHWKYYIGNYSHAEGSYITASGFASHAEGWNAVASGSCSHAEGLESDANDMASHAEGFRTTANQAYSHAEGYGTTASGSGAHAEGFESVANEMTSHAEGYGTTASGSSAHAEGYGTTASVNSAHAEGYETTASDFASHAEGNATTASGRCSHAQNSGTIAQRKSQTALGEFNVADTSGADGTVKGDYALIIGNGTADNARSNALTVDWLGNVEAAGYVSGKRETVYDNASGWTPSTSTGTTVNGKIANYSQVEVHLSDGSFGICNLSWGGDGTGVILGLLSYPYNEYIYMNCINFKLTPNGSNYTLLVPTAVQMPANYRIGTSVLKVTTVRKLQTIIGVVATHE